MAWSRGSNDILWIWFLSLCLQFCYIFTARLSSHGCWWLQAHILTMERMESIMERNCLPRSSCMSPSIHSDCISEGHCLAQFCKLTRRMELRWLASPRPWSPWIIPCGWKDLEHCLASPGRTGSPPWSYRLREGVADPQYWGALPKGIRVLSGKKKNPLKFIVNVSLTHFQVDGKCCNQEQCFLKGAPQSVSSLLICP